MQASVIRPKLSLLGISLGALLSAALIFCLPLAAQSPPAEAGQVVARLERGYARLIFSFASRPPHSINSSALNNNVLVLKFDRPIDIGINGAAERLPTYITAMRRGSDGQSLRFALARKIRVNTSEVGNDLYVDLLPEPWLGAPPPLPQAALDELARQAEEEERLRKQQEDLANRSINLGPVQVKSSEAPTFSRLEFLWREKVPVSLKRENDQLRVVFEKIGDINLAQLNARLPRFVENISVSRADARTIVTMKVDTMRDVRLFEEGNAIYLDIYGPQRGSKELRADGLMQQSDVPELALAGPGTAIYGENPADPATPPAQALPSFQMSVTQQQPPAKDSKQPPAAPLPMKAEAPEIIIPDTSLIEGGGSRIIFAFKTETAAAIFQRGRTLWLVFNTDEKIDTKPLATLLERKLRRINAEYQDKLAILRLELDAQLLVSAATLDTSWLITLGDRIRDKSDPAELKAHIAPDGRHIVNGYMNRAVSIQKIRDPIAGDDLTVVLAMGPPIGLVKPQNFIDFTALATTQGAALLPRVDDLSVRLDDIGFVVERPGSMAISVSQTPRTVDLSSQVQNSFGFVDFENWKLGAPDDFYKIRQSLIERAAMEEGVARNAARLDLARFYIAYEMGYEALGVLNLVARDDPATERELSFRIIRGVANMLSSRFDAAERDLSDPLLDDNADVAIWRGLNSAARRDWKFARRYLEKAQTVLTNYPRRLQAKVLMQLAHATIELSDLVNTDALLDEAANLVGDERGRAEVTLLRGRFNEAVGRYDAAIGFYKQVNAQEQPQYGTEATMRMVSLQEKLGVLPRAEAVKKIEALSFLWRGDDLELEMYRRLGEYLAKSDQFRRAFTVMRSANLADPDAEISRQLYDEMRVVFTSLYLDGKADDMPALEALSLFYDFRELTPAGHLGDEIIRGLAERLVDVDLLDQGIELLAHQVDKRLNGMARAEVGTELALVYLMNREPQKALSVLHRTRQTNMPEELERKRTLFEARALAGTGRPELAVELLSGDSMESMRLRADILWEGKSWQLCGEAIEKLLGERWQDAAPLSKQEKNDIMRGAVAFALAEDRRGLSSMRAKFMRVMEDTDEAHLFGVATSPIEKQGAEFRALARNLAAIDNLQDYWKEYSERTGRRRASEPAAEAKPSEVQEEKKPT